MRSNVAAGLFGLFFLSAANQSAAQVPPFLVKLGETVLADIAAPVAVDAIKHRLQQKEDAVKTQPTKLNALRDALKQANDAQLTYVTEVEKYLAMLKSNTNADYAPAQHAANQLVINLSAMGSALHDLDHEVTLFDPATQQTFNELRDARLSQIKGIPKLAGYSRKQRDDFAALLRANSGKFTDSVVETTAFIDKVEASKNKKS